MSVGESLLGRSVVRVFIRRTHLGHGVVKNNPNYSYIERVIDKAIHDTFMDMYLCMFSSPVEMCLPEEARRVYKDYLEKGYSEQDAETEATEIAERVNSEMACSIAKEYGIDCVPVRINDSGRPVFIPSNDTVYIGGYWGFARDPDTGALHPTVIKFERPLPKSELRRIVEKIHYIADEDNLEKLVFDSLEKKYGRDKAWRFTTCVSRGGCEVDGEIDERGNIKIREVRPLSPEWKKYIETGEIG